MQIINIKEHVEYKKAIEYIQSKWASKDSLKLYEDCIAYSLKTNSRLPVWYLLENQGKIIGCAGLITNDFISRMDLWPWVCALYIEENYRGNSLDEKLLLKLKEDTKNAGFDNLYLCTDHVGYYEKYDFSYINMFNKAKVKLRAEFTVSHINTLLKMIQEDLGLAIAPKFSLTSVPEGIAIKKLEPRFCREIALAVPALKEASIAVKLFIKEMRNLDSEAE